MNIKNIIEDMTITEIETLLNLLLIELCPECYGIWDYLTEDENDESDLERAHQGRMNE